MDTIARFVGVQDIEELTAAASERVLGIPQVDVLVLFGGAILAGADQFAQAMRNGVATTYVIDGGVGHTTLAFRQSVRNLCLVVEFSDSASEAEIFEAYLEYICGLHADLLETKSTNCGNNITSLRDLLAAYKVSCQSMILMGDETMQQRIAAVAAKEMPDIRTLSFASYQAKVVVDAEGASPAWAFKNEPRGMWCRDHYLELLMEEAPRLTDTADGYGPKGKNFIVPVGGVPAEVTRAWNT